MSKYVPDLQVMVRLYQSLKDGATIVHAIENLAYSETGRWGRCIHFQSQNMQLATITYQTVQEYACLTLEGQEIDDDMTSESPEYQAIYRRFLRNFDQAQQFLINELGIPKFAGTYGQKGYPDTLSCSYHMTYWLEDNYYISLSMDVGDYYDAFVIEVHVGPVELAQEE